MDTSLRDEHLHLLQSENKVLLNYGTSGFRDNAKYLKFVGWRVGLFVGMMSRNSKEKLGVMITASHNKIIDNGFKIVPPKGGMLSMEDEKHIEQFYKSEAIETIQMQYDNGTVFVGRDTRPTCEELSNIVLEGIKAAGATGLSLGVVTTPQCAFLIYAHNMGWVQDIQNQQSFYVDYFSQIFIKLVQNKIAGPLVIDGAEGVGGKWAKEFTNTLKDVLTIRQINSGEEGHLLNEQCGSEFVQKQKTLPKNFEYDPTCRYASVDGDADRLVYYSYSDTLSIIEGDRFAILFAQYIKQQIKDINLSIGIIQTAYANSASTKFIMEQIGIDAKYEPTGVKYLHRAAHHYDIGIYFEANGHGAVIYKDHVLDLLKQHNLLELELFLRLSNQAVGDALTNILMTEFLLHKLQLSVTDWLQQYKDYPAISTKLYVKNKNIIKTNYEETQLVEPIGNVVNYVDLKEKVDTIMSKYDKNYRTCIRPSGTEDVVRVHSEGPQLGIVKQIDQEINQLLREYMII